MILLPKQLQFLNDRIRILDKIHARFTLERLVDYGYNSELYETLDYAQIQVIEKDKKELSSSSPNVTVVTGDYLTKLPEYLGNNTCYTCFVFLRGDQVADDKFIAEYKAIQSLLSSANLTNSFLVLWIRELSVVNGNTQNFRIFNLETNSDITEQFTSID